MLTSEALTAYLADHRSRGSRGPTIVWYDSTIRRVLKGELGREVGSFTPFDLNRLMTGEGLAPASLANHDRALRGFFNWLEGVEVISENPFRKRKRPRDSFKLKQVLSPAEIQALFHAAAVPGSRHRNQALLALFLECGLRAGEVARLQLSDINWSELTLQIEGKNGNSALPLSRKGAQLLRTYVSQERKTLGQSLFVHHHQPLTSLGLSKWVARLGERAGIERPIGPHLLRHTFATHFLRAGGDAFTLRRLMRHTTMTMTMRYVNYVTGDLAQSAQKHSPLAHIQF